MRDFWVTRLTAAQNQLTQADDALFNALNELESYTLDTGVGRQTTRYKKIEKLEAALRNIETRVIWINQKINGGGVVNLNLRRRSGALWSRYNGLV
jgi:hypothetical protein